jgi:hypothetical protein
MKRVARTLAAFCYALVVFGLTACGDDEDTGTGLEDAISIALSASSLTITQGGSGVVNVTLTRRNGFTGAVAVTIEGLPTGVTAPAISIADWQTSGTLDVTPSATAAAATTTLTVRAAGTDVRAATAPLWLVVQAAPATGFTMSMSPTTLSVPVGASGNSTVTITRTGGFSGPVTLTATGLPSGVSASFNPQSVTGTTSALTLTAAAGAAWGPTIVTVTGTAAGVTNQTTAASLTVFQPPSSGGNVSAQP